VVEVSEEHQVVERALVHAVQPSLVAVQQMQFGAVGQIGKSGGDTVQFIAFRAFRNAVIEQPRFNRPQTPKTPGAGNHFLDGVHFDLVRGREFGHVQGENLVERLLRFVLKHNSVGQEAVSDGVRGRSGACRPQFWRPGSGLR
jgi:hypothetical protein